MVLQAQPHTPNAVKLQAVYINGRIAHCGILALYMVLSPVLKKTQKDMHKNRSQEAGIAQP